MDAFRFYAWPWLGFLPFILLLMTWHLRVSNRPAAVFSSLSDLKGLPVTMAQRVHRRLPWLYALGLCLILVAIARPQSGKSGSRITGEGIAIELALDISGSMDAVDFDLNGKQVNRLEAVKHVVSEFVLGSRSSELPGRKDDLVGLVAFGGFADSKCPLTLDHGGLVQIVRELDTPKRVRDRRGNVINEAIFRDESATAIGDGVALAVDRLRNANAKSKVLILLTDGDNNAGVVEPTEAALIAKESGIKIYSIGIGRDGVVPVPQEDAFGKTVLVPAQFRIDEELPLRRMGDTFTRRIPPDFLKFMRKSIG
jgi:Ca-activated chloride channel homolog